MLCLHCAIHPCLCGQSLGVLPHLGEDVQVILCCTFMHLDDSVHNGDVPAVDVEHHHLACRQYRQAGTVRAANRQSALQATAQGRYLQSGRVELQGLKCTQLLAATQQPGGVA